MSHTTPLRRVRSSSMRGSPDAAHSAHPDPLNPTDMTAQLDETAQTNEHHLSAPLTPPIHALVSFGADWPAADTNALGDCAAPATPVRIDSAAAAAATHSAAAASRSLDDSALASAAIGSHDSSRTPSSSFLFPAATTPLVRRRSSRTPRKVVPDYLGAVTAPARAMQGVEDALAGSTTAAAALESASVGSVAAAAAASSEFDAPLQLPPTPHVGVISPFRPTLTASACASPWVLRSPLQSLDVQSRSPLAVSSPSRSRRLVASSSSPSTAAAAASRPTSIYQAERARLAASQAQAQAQLALSGRAALPAPYLRVLHEAKVTAGKNLAQNAFASSYGSKSQPAAFGSLRSPPPLTAASSQVNPAFSASTWSNFRFDPHAFAAATSKPDETVSAGVAASTSTTSTGPSLFEQMTRRELQEMEQITQQSIAALQPEDPMAADDPITRRDSTSLDADLPPLPLLPTSQSPRKARVIAGVGLPAPYLTRTPVRPSEPIAAADVDPPVTPSPLDGLPSTSSAVDMFTTPEAPPKRHRGRPRSVISSASSAALAAFSAPTHTEEASRQTTKRKVQSDTRVARPRRTGSGAKVESDELQPLRIKKRSVRAMLTQAEQTHQRLANPTSVSHVDDDVDSEDEPRSGLSAAQHTQLRAQVQLHAQLLAQSIWLCSVLPPAPSRNHSRVKKQANHALVGMRARTLMQELVQVAGAAPDRPSPVASPPPSPLDHDGVAQIILDLAVEAGSPRHISRADSGSSQGSGSGRKRRKIGGGRRALVDSTDEDDAAEADRGGAAYADDNMRPAPYGEVQPIEIESHRWSLLHVPALGIWTDPRFQSLPLVPMTIVAAEDDKENTPLSSPIGASYQKSQAGRALLSLPSATVHQFWDELVPIYHLDARYFPKLLPHERHLFTVGEEHLFNRGLQQMQWEMTRTMPVDMHDAVASQSGSVTALLAATRLAIASGSVTLPPKEDVGGSLQLPSTGDDALESMLLIAIRRRFLPAKSLSELRERMHKLARKEEHARQVLAGHTAGTASSAGVSTTAESLAPSALMSPSPSVTSPAAASTISGSSLNEHAPVTALRDFTPRELELASIGWREFHASRTKWSEISMKYLPAWPRKLLAKAWMKHSERAVRTMTATGATPTTATDATAGRSKAAKKKRLFANMEDEELVSVAHHHDDVVGHAASVVSTGVPVSTSAASGRMEFARMDDEEEEATEAHVVHAAVAATVLPHAHDTTRSPVAAAVASVLTSAPTPVSPAAAAVITALMASFTPAKPVAAANQSAA